MNTPPESMTSAKVSALGLGTEPVQAATREFEPDRSRLQKKALYEEPGSQSRVGEWSSADRLLKNYKSQGQGTIRLDPAFLNGWRVRDRS